MISYVRKIIMIPIAIFSLSACNENHYTVDYYLDNKKERLEKIVECSNDVSRSEIDSNCKNAFAAELKESAGDIRAY